MTVVLGIDTSSAVGAGVAVDGAVVSTGVVSDTRAHAEQLMPLVQRVVAESGVGGLGAVSAIAVGVGPGPFTGLRVGVVAAVVLAEALGVGVRGVCSLDVMARQVIAAGLAPSSEFVVATDARRKEWYWARYAVRDADTGDSPSGSSGQGGTDTGDSPSIPAGGPVPAFGGTVPMPSPDPAFGGTVPMASAVRRVAGPFVTSPGEVPDLPRFGPVSGTPLHLDAGVLAAVAADLPEAGLEPLYLRRPDAQVPTARKSTLLPPRLAPRSTR